MRAPSSARVIAYAAPTSSTTSSASGLLNRNISTATGVSAITAPATSAAACEKCRRTVAYRSHTAPTPSSACGTRMLHELTPKARAESSMTQREAGGLSTVIAFDQSKDPKKNAFHDFVPAWTAAE